MKPCRVLLLTHPDLVPPESLKGFSEEEINVWKTEYDVVSTLRGSGHEVMPLGVSNELRPIRDAVESFKPHVVFNLLEEFHGEAVYDHSVVSYLELTRVAYTGCNPRGLVLSRGKDLAKKLVHYHRVPTPAFAVFPIGRKIKRPPRLTLPLIVKSLNEDASMGIAQASVVETDEALAERVTFIHERIGTAAIAEQYIEGREIYVGVIGNNYLRTYTPWELEMTKLPEGTANIATGKVKWNPKYQEKVGLKTHAADCTPELRKRLESLSKRIYRLLSLSGYARLDYRVTEDGRIYLLEANPNPQIAHKEDFADSAEDCGVQYGPLLQKIMTLGLSYDPATV
jgi:D-alanine-D-alanine ligase